MRLRGVPVAVVLAALAGLVQISGRAEQVPQLAEQFEGTLLIVWGDPHPESNAPGEVRYSLASDTGEVHPLLVGGAVGVNVADFGRRVRVTGRRLARQASAIAAQVVDFSAADPIAVETIVRNDAAVQAAAAAGAEAAVTGVRKVIYLLVQFADDTARPHPASFYLDLTNPLTPPAGSSIPATINGFFTKTSWDQLSWQADVGGLGGVGAPGGWLTLPNPKSYYAPCGFGATCANLGSLAADAIAVAKANGISFLPYDNINFVLSDDLDCCAWGGGYFLDGKLYGATWEPPWGQETGTYVHELGHSIGLPHSGWVYYSYDSPWDMMSDRGSDGNVTCGSYVSANGGGLTSLRCTRPGNGYITPHKDVLGWIPSQNIVEADTISNGTWTIEGGALPLGAALKMLKVCLPDYLCTGSTARYLTIEARVKNLAALSQFDNAIPGEGIIIHEVQRDRPPIAGQCFSSVGSVWARPIDPNGGWDPAACMNTSGVATPLSDAQFEPGDVYTDSTYGFALKVDSRSGSTFDVSISRGAGPPTIITQPESRGIAVGTTASLRVQAAGAPTLDYQWYQGVSPNTANPITGATSPTFVTPTLFTPTNYWVRVSNGLGSTNSNTAIVSAVAGTVVFQDDMESGSGAWSAQPPWALTTETAKSGSYAWSDSPGGDYQNVLARRLRTTTNLSAPAVSPQLKFWHRLDVGPGDNAAVDVLGLSCPGSGDKSVVQAFCTGAAYCVYSSTGGNWQESTLDLSSLDGCSTLQVTFWLNTDASGTADGWYIDDVVLTVVAAAPTVTAVTPSAGPSTGGTAVTITGTNFLTGATVSIGGVAATGVTVQNATTITATTGPHAAGVVDVTVTNPDTQSGTKTNAFTYLSSAPTVTSIAPTSGSSAGGTVVTITGTNFVTGATVSIGGVAATGVTVQNATTITATTGAHAAGVVDVTVTNPNTQSGTKTNAFTYLASAPTVTSIAPTSGSSAGGTAVTITGTNFVTGATVSIGGVAATGVTVQNATTITATTGAHAAGVADVIVTNPDTQSGTKSSAFTYLGPAPTVTAIAPTFGSTAGSTAVTITGTNFVTGATVLIGDVAATGVIVANATTITATTPAHPAGTVDVVVTNPDAQTGSKAAAFTFVAPPTVTTINPVIGPTAGGQAVTIAGTNFVTGAAVSIGGVSATGVTVVNATTITATTGPHPAGVVSVVVTNPNAATATLTNAYTYVLPPTVSSIAPAFGPVTGGTAVTIIGSGFRTDATVTVGGVAATDVIVVNATRITATTAAHAAGFVGVVVTNSDAQSGTLPNSFSYSTGAAPSVLGITPNSGSENGGTLVTISGADFMLGATASIGGVVATNVTVLSPSSLTATTPAHAAGVVNVVLTNPDAQLGTLLNGFTYTSDGAATAAAAVVAVAVVVVVAATTVAAAVVAATPSRQRRTRRAT